jgi:hypothetical protein
MSTEAQKPPTASSLLREGSMTGEAKQVPLTERLLSVPLRARLSIDSDDGKCTSCWPIGLMCYEAAQALQALREEVEGLRRDAERIDWLCEQYVVVRIPLRYGSKECFQGSPEDGDGETFPWDIRASIDAAIRNGGEGC